MKEIIKELSISVACLLDDLEDITQEDIEHIQNLVTQLENIVDPVGENKWPSMLKDIMGKKQAWLR